MYNFGTDAAYVSSLPFKERMQLAVDLGSKIHPQMREEFMSGFAVAWHLEPYSLGAWPSYNERKRTETFPVLQEPNGRIYLVGEHLSYVNAWMDGAVQAAWMRVEKLHSRVLQAQPMPDGRSQGEDESMNVNTRLRMRLILFVGAVLLAGSVTVPLMSSAQESSPEPAADPVIERGRMIYQTVCIACHQVDGKGIAGIYLPLAGNPAVTLEDPTYLITVLLNGHGGMPTFANTYDDDELAAIATYIRQEWGNTGAPVTADQVAAVRASIENPGGSPIPEGQVPSGIATPGASPAATPVA